jgi:hypothetical protein
VLENLLSNAAKFSPAGSLICVTLDEYDGLARVRVEDEGPGIAEQDRPLIFEKFYRAPSAQSAVPGTGLGLAICRGIVEAHGGHIWVEASTTGHGAAFVVTLPRAAVDEAAFVRADGPDEGAGDVVMASPGRSIRRRMVGSAVGSAMSIVSEDSADAAHGPALDHAAPSHHSDQAS